MWKWAKVKVFLFFLFFDGPLPVLHIIIICLNCFSLDLFTSRAFLPLTLVCRCVRTRGSRRILTTLLKIYYYTRHAAKSNGPARLFSHRNWPVTKRFYDPASAHWSNGPPDQQPPTYRHLSTHPHPTLVGPPGHLVRGEEDIRCSDDLAKSVWRFVETLAGGLVRILWTYASSAKLRANLTASGRIMSHTWRKSLVNVKDMQKLIDEMKIK